MQRLCVPIRGLTLVRDVPDGGDVSESESESGLAAALHQVRQALRDHGLAGAPLRRDRGSDGPSRRVRQKLMAVGKDGTG